MALNWIDLTDKTHKVIKTTHEGCVVKFFDREIRVMSDIWADEHFAVVYNPESKTFDTISIGIGFELYNGPYAYGTVDLLPEYKAELDRQTAEANARAREYEQARYVREAAERVVAAEKARVAAEAAEVARIARLAVEPHVGMRVKVIKGRKVKIGTEGTCFWKRDGRIGVAITEDRDAAGRYSNVVWLDSANAEAVLA